MKTYTTTPLGEPHRHYSFKVDYIYTIHMWCRSGADSILVGGGVFVLYLLTAQIYDYKHEKDEYIHSPKTGIFFTVFHSRVAAGCQRQPRDRNSKKGCQVL